MSKRLQSLEIIVIDLMGAKGWRSFGTVTFFLALLSAVRLDADDVVPLKTDSAQNANRPRAEAITFPASSSSKVANVDDPTLDQSDLEDGVVTGIVVDVSDGKPVVSATVFLFGSFSIQPKPIRVTANGRESFRSSNLAHVKIHLSPGEVEVIHFVEPDSPRK